MQELTAEVWKALIFNALKAGPMDLRETQVTTLPKLDPPKSATFRYGAIPTVVFEDGVTTYPYLIPNMRACNCTVAAFGNFMAHKVAVRAGPGKIWDKSIIVTLSRDAYATTASPSAADTIHFEMDILIKGEDKAVDLSCNFELLGARVGPVFVGDKEVVPPRSVHFLYQHQAGADAHYEWWTIKGGKAFRTWVDSQLKPKAKEPEKP